MSDTDDRTTNDKTLTNRIFYLNYTEYAQKKFTCIYINSTSEVVYNTNKRR